MVDSEGQLLSGSGQALRNGLTEVSESSVFIGDFFLLFIPGFELRFGLHAVLPGLLSALEDLVLVARKQVPQSEHALPVDRSQADREVPNADRPIVLCLKSPPLLSVLLDILLVLPERASEAHSNRDFLPTIGSSQPHALRQLILAIQELINVSNVVLLPLHIALRFER